MNNGKRKTQVKKPSVYGEEKLPLHEYLNRPLTIDGHKVDDRIMSEFLDWSFVTGSTDFKKFWAEYTSTGYKPFSKTDMEAAHDARAEAAAEFENDYKAAYDSFLGVTDDPDAAARMAREHASAIFKKKLEARLGGK